MSRADERTDERIIWQLNAQLTPDLARLTGELTLYLRPRQVRHDLQLWFYPQTLNRLKDADELTFRRVYPRGFSAASLAWTPARVGSGGDSDLTLLPLIPAEEGGMPNGGAFRPSCVGLTLHPPVPPEDPVRLKGAYRLEIPERAGTFGRLDGQLTLLEGFLPQLVPQPDAVPEPELPGAPVLLELTLLLPADQMVLLGGQKLDQDRLGRCDALRKELPQGLPPGQVCVSGSVEGKNPSLVVGRLHATPLSVGNMAYWDGRRSPRDVRQLERILARAYTCWRNAGLPEPVSVPPLVRAPLRRTLLEAGEGVVLLSDRALRTFPGVQRFHEYALVRGLLAVWLQLARPGLVASTSTGFAAGQTGWAVPPYSDEALAARVAEGLASQLLQDYRTHRWLGRLKARDVLDPLGFLPPIDAMLNAPQFAFASEIYEDPHRYDLWQERLDQLRQPAPSGEGLFLRLEDRFGAGAVARASEAALAGRSDFLGALAGAAGVSSAEVQAFVAGWRRPPARLDYRLSDVAMRKTPAGFETSFVISERWALPKGAPPDPRPLPDETVPIVVTAHDQVARLKWEGQDQQTFTVTTRQPVQRIEIDPEQHVLESNPAGVLLRDNNRWPKPARLLMSAALTSLDVASLRPTGSVQLSLTAPYQRDWLSAAEVYSTAQTLLGFSVGTFRFLGPYRDAQWRNHRIGVQVLGAHRADLPWLGGSDAFLDTLGGRISWRYESRQLLTDATRGGSAYVGLEVGGAKTADTTGLYGVWTLQGVKPWSLHPRLVVVGRGQLDLSLGLPEGNGGPGEGLFSLGGSTLLRAMEAGTRVGNQRWVASLEPRFELLHDLDLNLGVGRLRRVQAVVFVDTGAVSYQPADLSKLSLGLGTGFRLYLDMFGLYEGLAGLDLAWLELQDGGVGGAGEALGGSPRVLLRFTQPF